MNLGLFLDLIFVAVLPPSDPGAMKLIAPEFKVMIGPMTCDVFVTFSISFGQLFRTMGYFKRFLKEDEYRCHVRQSFKYRNIK